MIKKLIPSVLVFLLAGPLLAAAGGRSYFHGRPHYGAHVKKHAPHARFKHPHGYGRPRRKGFLHDHSGRYRGHRFFNLYQYYRHYVPHGAFYRNLRRYHYDRYHSHRGDFYHDRYSPHYE